MLKSMLVYRTGISLPSPTWPASNHGVFCLPNTVYRRPQRQISPFRLLHLVLIPPYHSYSTHRSSRSRGCRLAPGTRKNYTQQDKYPAHAQTLHSSHFVSLLVFHIASYNIFHSPCVHGRRYLGLSFNTYQDNWSSSGLFKGAIKGRSLLALTSSMVFFL
jgi:hypothetical protein